MKRARRLQRIGDRFTSLTGFLPPEQYARRLCDVAAERMDRPFDQGLENLLARLLRGKQGVRILFMDVECARERASGYRASERVPPDIPGVRAE